MTQTIFYNAQVVTMNEKHPQAEAVLVEDGKIVKVGQDSEILAP